MKQVVFLIDTSWLQDEETTIAVRFSCLQILTTWAPNTCKYGFMLFNSEAPRTQKVETVPFSNPTTTSVEEFENRLTEGLVSNRIEATESSQLETIRWAVSRSVTDFGWHSVSVTSPVKASRKRRQTGALKQQEQESRNMMFLFSRPPSRSLASIRDELVTASLGKCLQENRIELIWVHDAVDSSVAGSNKCHFLKMRDLVRLCGVFPTEELQYTASLAPRSKVVEFLLQRTKPQPLSSCELNMNHLYNPIEMSIFSSQSDTTVVFKNAGKELRFLCLLECPDLASMLSKCSAVYIATSRDVHFHRFLVELQALKSAAIVTCEKTTYVIQPVADSVAVLCEVVDRSIAKFEPSEISTKLFDSVYLDPTFKAESKLTSGFSITEDRLKKLQTAYHEQSAAQPPEAFKEIEKSFESDSMHSNDRIPENISESYASEVALLEQMKITFERAVEGKMSLAPSAQSIVSATVHFFEKNFVQTKEFLQKNFPAPLKSDRTNDVWANECRVFILMSFEIASLDASDHSDIKKQVIAAMRKLLFLSSPSKVFDFIRETLKGLYLETVRSLLEDIAEEFDLPLFADSDEENEHESSIGSIAEPLSGISSLAPSVTNSVPQPVNRAEVQGNPLRRVSSLNLSQRQIQMPRRKSVRVQQPEVNLDRSPVKSSQNRDVPTTPKGKRVLKTQVVPETPVAKQAPDRVRRNQERLRRRSSILTSSQMEDNVMEVDESPVKGRMNPTPTKAVIRSPMKAGTPHKSLMITGTPIKAVEQTPDKRTDDSKMKTPTGTPKKTPMKSPRKSLTRKLMFSPQKKAFTSPTAISLLHLTTSPVLYKPTKKK